MGTSATRNATYAATLLTIANGSTPLDNCWEHQARSARAGQRRCIAWFNPAAMGHKILHAATRKGPLPDDHPADALGYRISSLAERMAPQSSSWETIEPSHRSPHPEPPPSLGPPSRGPGISF